MIFLSGVIQSSASVTGVQTWFKWKELNIKLSSTTSVKWIIAICLISESRSIGWVFGLVSRRFDKSIFRSLHVASVMVSKVKFEERQSRLWKSRKRSHDCLFRSTDCFHNNPSDKEESALPPTCASGCISPTHAFCLRQKARPVVIH